MPLLLFWAAMPLLWLLEWIIDHPGLTVGLLIAALVAVVVWTYLEQDYLDYVQRQELRARRDQELLAADTEHQAARRHLQYEYDRAKACFQAWRT